MRYFPESGCTQCYTVGNENSGYKARENFQDFLVC